MKSEYKIRRIGKDTSKGLLLTYHYLKDESKGFKSGYNYGLDFYGQIVGVVIYTGFPVPELAKGCYGLERDDQEGLFELSRLVLRPDVQEVEHNLASWFVSRSIRQLRRDTKVRAILSYADDNHHTGTVYRACNFKYYGMSAAKKDFWIEQPDGSYVKHSRGKTKGIKGEWRPRSRKHRYLMTFDKSLECKWIPTTTTNDNKRHTRQRRRGGH